MVSFVQIILIHRSLADSMLICSQLSDTCANERARACLFVYDVRVCLELSCETQTNSVVIGYTLQAWGGEGGSGESG